MQTMIKIRKSNLELWVVLRQIFPSRGFEKPHVG